MRDIDDVRYQRIGAVVAMLLLFSGCASLRPGAKLTATGKASFYNLQLAKEVDHIAHFVADAEAGALISAADATKAMNALAQVNRGQKDLEDVIGAGNVSGDAKAKAVAMIKQGLQEIPGYLSGNAKTIAQGYVSSALILLTWFS